MWNRKQSFFPNIPLAKNRANLYQQNKTELSFIPSLFLALVLAIIIILSWIYFRGGFDFSSTGTPKTQQLVATVAGDFQSRNNSQSSSTANQADVDTSGFFISNKSGQICQLQQIQNTDLFQTIVSKTNQILWQAKDCPENKLLGVQVVVLTDLERTQSIDKLSQSNVQLLDQEDSLYALVYTQNNQDSEFSFERYLHMLSMPVFPNKYFDPTSVFDLRQIDNLTYYLNGNCQIVGTKPCRLWSVHKTTGFVELIKTNVGNTGKGQEFEIRPRNILRFAKLQDYQNGVNLIFLDESTGPINQFKLLRIDTTTGNIAQTLDIKLFDNAYKDYYR